MPRALARFWGRRSCRQEILEVLVMKRVDWESTGVPRYPNPTDPVLSDLSDLPDGTYNGDICHDLYALHITHRCTVMHVHA